MNTKTLKTLLFIASIAVFSTNTLAANIEPFDQITTKAKSTDNAQMKYSFVLKKSSSSTVLMEVPAIYANSTINSSFPPLPVTMKNTSVRVFLKRMKGLKKSESLITTYKYTIPTFQNPGSYTRGLSDISNRLGFSQNVQMPTDLSQEGLIFSDLYAKKYIEKLLGHSISEPTFDSNNQSTSGNDFIETFVIGSKTFSYTKIANDGSKLPKTAKLGTGDKDWACTKDNTTGLIWELKTTDGGLRDWNNRYTNYFFGDIGYGTSNNADVFVSAVNKQTLCGKFDWRLPTKDELMKLVVCSDGKYDADGSCTNEKKVTQPTINSAYFPNTQQKPLYWSSSPNAYSSSGAWGIYFGGGSQPNVKYDNYFVRLVR
jgi:hypothetical protein